VNLLRREAVLTDRRATAEQTVDHGSYIDPDLAWCQPQPPSRARARACVLHRVRQSFLYEPEDNQLNARRRVPGIPLRSYRTGNLAIRTRVNRPSRSDRPGSGCRSSCPPSARRMPSRRRVSASASRAVPDTPRIASAAWVGAHGLGEGIAPERPQGAEQGRSRCRRPRNAAGAFPGLDRCPEGGTRILAAFPRGQCFFLRRRGGAAARRPGRSARRRSRTGTRIRSRGSAAGWRPGCPTGPRRRWTAGRARTH
jgi:hypothetical protein